MSTASRRWCASLLGVLALTFTLLLPVASASLPGMAGVSGPEAPQSSTPTAAGSYELANVRILSVPALTVASPVVTEANSGPAASRRAAVIEGNLSLLYNPQPICTNSEAISEEVLEGLVLKGSDRACAGARWGVRGHPDDLRIEVRRNGKGLNVLEARLPDHPQPLPLLTVTDADARLNGVSTDVLAGRWRSLLERRLRHARRTMEEGAIEQRLQITLLIELGLAVLLTFFLWLLGQSRRFAQRLQEASESAPPTPRRQLTLQLSHGISNLLFLLVLAQLVVMLGLAVMAFPGHIPLGLALVMQPFGALVKVLVMGLLAAALRLLANFLLHQWAGSLHVPVEQRARRDQRYRSLLRVSHRLIDLTCISIVVVWILIGIPGVQEASSTALLAGGALIGGLAFVFQGLLRDFVAGLLVLLDDRYAIGDWVELGGNEGEVEDVGVLSTELRCTDQRVVVIQNSSFDRVINHTKFASGADVRLQLSPEIDDINRALAVFAKVLEGFSADPDWNGRLLKQPWLRGVNAINPLGIEISVVLTTRSGEQWLCSRELQRRLLEELQRARIPLAKSGSAVQA